MSIVTERARRTTAGKRMTVLTGEALQQDETFWGHETWVDDDSGNESFHSSDEDSELKRDVFDSDFDESESDEEEDEEGAGRAEEKELAREERESRALSNRSYVDSVRTTKDLKRCSKGKNSKVTSKRIVGDGLNAGIVLNDPSHKINDADQNQSATECIRSTEVTVATKPFQIRKGKEDKSTKTTAAATRPTRVATRLGRQTSKVESFSTSSKVSVPTKKKRRRYSQEELLLEAIHITEAENERWLLGRKRRLAETEKEKETSTKDHRGILIEKFVSRRGYLNTINFPDMDHVPTILVRDKDTPQPPATIFCAITGKPARYRDPLTQLGYFDSSAFKELRRRFETGEPLISFAEKSSTATAASETAAAIDTSATASSEKYQKSLIGDEVAHDKRLISETSNGVNNAERKCHSNRHHYFQTSTDSTTRNRAELTATSTLRSASAPLEVCSIDVTQITRDRSKASNLLALVGSDSHSLLDQSFPKSGVVSRGAITSPSATSPHIFSNHLPIQKVLSTNGYTIWKPDFDPDTNKMEVGGDTINPIESTLSSMYRSAEDDIILSSAKFTKPESSQVSSSFTNESLLDEDIEISEVAGLASSKNAVNGTTEIRLKTSRSKELSTQPVLSNDIACQRIDSRSKPRDKLSTGKHSSAKCTDNQLLSRRSPRKRKPSFRLLENFETEVDAGFFLPPTNTEFTSGTKIKSSIKVATLQSSSVVSKFGGTR